MAKDAVLVQSSASVKPQGAGTNACCHPPTAAVAWSADVLSLDGIDVVGFVLR